MVAGRSAAKAAPGRPRVAPRPHLLALLLASGLVAVLPAGLDPAQCTWVPAVSGVDQSSSTHLLNGSCSEALLAAAATAAAAAAGGDDELLSAAASRARAAPAWCRAPPLQPWPSVAQALPPLSSRPCLKFGRLHSTPGPLLGGGSDDRLGDSSSGMSGACGLPVVGADDKAFASLSIKYMPHSALSLGLSAATEDVADSSAAAALAAAAAPATCGRCLCVALTGADALLLAPEAQPDLMAAVSSTAIGLTFAAVAADRHVLALARVRCNAFFGMHAEALPCRRLTLCRCAECADDQLRVLLDRPLSYAPYNASTNRLAPWVRGRTSACAWAAWRPGSGLIALAPLLRSMHAGQPAGRVARV